MYTSTYANMAEQFEIYLNSVPPDQIGEIENDFKANGNGLNTRANYLILL